MTRPILSRAQAIQILVRHLPEPSQPDRRSEKRQAIDARRLEIQRRLQAGERHADLAAHLQADPRIGRITPGQLRTLLTRTGVLSDTPDPRAPPHKAWTSGHGPVSRGS